MTWFGPEGPEQGESDVFVDDEFRGTVDGHARRPTAPVARFKVSGLSLNRIHTIRVVARGDRDIAAGDSFTTIEAFAAAEPIHYPTELMKLKNAEYALIQSGTKPFSPADNWVPVRNRASVPIRGVRVNAGIYRDMLDRNLAYLNYCFSQDGYCSAGAVPFHGHGGPGWSRWLPASNEGRMLAGAAGALRWEEREDMRVVVGTILGDIAERTRDDGYYNYYSDDNYAAQYVIDGERKNYDRVFWTRGLLAAGLVGHQTAYLLARKMYDWFNKCDRLPFMLEGPNATNGLPGGPMMYLSPVGADADLVVSQRHYDQDFWMTELANSEPLCFTFYPGDRPHCYELLGIEAAIDEYRATGDRKYIDASLGGWTAYRENFLHIGGASSICEDKTMIYPPKSYYINEGHTGEACGSVFWININSKLLCLEPQEEKYAAEIESALINVLGAAQDHRGFIRYHSKLEGSKDEAKCSGTCCEVSTVGLIGRLPELIYSIGDDEIFVNLYGSSVLTWDSPSGDIVVLKMASAFPDSGDVSIEVQTDRPIGLTIYLRIPWWTVGPVAIAVNGLFLAEGQPGSYSAIKRIWTDGDSVVFSLPMKFTAIEYTGFNQIDTGEPRYGFLYGPSLMALVPPIGASSDIPRIDHGASTVSDYLVPTGKVLEFSVLGDAQLRCVPYWSVTSETFTCFPVLRRDDSSCR